MGKKSNASTRSSGQSSTPAQRLNHSRKADVQPSETGNRAQKRAAEKALKKLNK